MIGRTLGHYKILDKVGSGGFATVYMGRDMRTNEIVAIKVLYPQYAEDVQFIKRFRREAQTLQALPHSPHIVHLREFEEQEGICCIIMEYLEGRDLDDILAQQRPLSLSEALSIATQVVEALEVAYRQGVVHRDIKPANIKLTPDGVVKVMDFGIARATEGTKLTKSGAFIGTAAYMAPEIWEGKPADIRSDIYSWGMMLYEMLAGKAPFDADTPAAVMRMHLVEQPPRLRTVRRDAPAWLERVLARAIAKNPADRFQTPGELLKKLREKRVVEPSTEVASLPSTQRSFSTWLPIIGGLAAMGLLMLAATGMFLIFIGLQRARYQSVAVAPTVTPTSMALIVPTLISTIYMMAPTPSSSPTITVTTAPTTTATATMPYPAPVLKWPPPGFKFDSFPLSFEWEWEGTLGHDEHFDLKIKPKDSDDSVFFTWTKKPGYELREEDLARFIDSNFPPGEYRWSVQIIRGHYSEDSTRILDALLSPESAEDGKLRSFYWRSEPPPRIPANMP